MNKLKRGLEVITFLENGCALGFPEVDTNRVYTMDTKTDNILKMGDAVSMIGFNQFMDIASLGMKEIYESDIFDLCTMIPKCAICVTTNGMIKNNGHAIMGAGVAKDFATRYPHLPQLLGTYLTQYENRVFYLGTVEMENPSTKEKCQVGMFSFPTKHDWRNNSDINLIKTSCKQLKEVTQKFGFDTVLLPAPGVTNGKLSYDKVVRPAIASLLDEHFYICLKDYKKDH